MDKFEFLMALQEGLRGLPQEDVQRSLDYYSEIIDDRVEDGMTEPEAVAALGPVEEIISQILMDTPLPKLVKARVKPQRKLRGWEIVLLVLGSPVWMPILIAALAIVLSMYLVLWSLILTLYAVDLSLAAAGVAGVLGSLAYVPFGNYAPGGMMIAAGMVCAGVAILLFFGFNQIARSIWGLTKSLGRFIKSRFVRGGSVL